MKKATIHGQDYEYYSWADLGESIFSLASQIIESGQQFDRVIALAKGGLAFSRSLVDYLDIKEISTFQIEFYSGIAETGKTPVITQSLPVQVKNERVLVFDDVADKGDTLKMATQYLGYHGVKSATTAVLISKPWSTFKVDFAAHQSKAWIIFPNEARETIQTLITMWQAKGDSQATIKEQLQQVGFSQPEVALFAKLD